MSISGIPRKAFIRGKPHLWEPVLGDNPGWWCAMCQTSAGFECLITALREMPVAEARVCPERGPLEIRRRWGGL